MTSDMPHPQSSQYQGRPESGKRSQHSGLSAISGPARPEAEPTQETRSDSKSGTSKSTKRKKNRHRKRRARRQSFLAADDTHAGAATAPGPDTGTTATLAADRPALPFYKLGAATTSSTSLESEALLDHRDQPMLKPRRESRLAQSFRPGSLTTTLRPGDIGPRSPMTTMKNRHADSDSDDSEADDRTPLVRPSSSHNSNLLRYGTDSKSSPYSYRPRRPSVHTVSSNSRDIPSPDPDRDYDINNPPSMPTSPKLGPEMGYDDAVVTGADFDFSMARSIENHRRGSLSRSHDMVIDMEGCSPRHNSAPSPPPVPHEALRRRRTVAFPVEEDVCFPIAEPSELAEEDAPRTSREDGRRRRRHRRWPDLGVLDEWSREEKEDRHGDFRTKQISEPMLIEGRLRPQYKVWRREEDEAPYRFTYFNEEFQNTIHAQTISELVQPGGSFRELFVPDPPELEDSSSDEDSEEEFNNQPIETNHNADHYKNASNGSKVSSNAPSIHHTNHLSSSHDANEKSQETSENRPPRTMSIISEAVSDARSSAGDPHLRAQQTEAQAKPKRYGPRPTFWLDVLCPTDAEMRVIAKAFGIHALTAEDIMMQEAREKVELFRNYYFVNYRTFEQDPSSEDHLEPVNMYVVVFREGVLSFHFSQTPHPANVRRRIRQLMDYLILSSDWISYALIDDITDVFGPLIQAIEDEVDEIDESIMRMHSPGRKEGEKSSKDDASDGGSATLNSGEMLRRVGECRKKVMGMYRLLSNKADVVKGFAKRCNEQWEVAPKSEIGLYLGDIQDHIMTMTSSLTYYETILSRAHSNYLAQINILMNERQEQTADVLGKLTVLGTIVLPLNIICGMWGMNVKVPGQDMENLHWFWSITGGLVLFAIASFYIAKRVYKIV